MDQIPISKTNGHASYEHDTDVDIAILTAKFTDFAKWNLWSPFYTKMDQIGDGSQQVGNSQALLKQRVYRTIMNKPSDRDNIEELYDVVGTPKEGKVTIKYRSVQNANVHIVKIETVITLTKIEDGKTNINWTSDSAIHLNFDENVKEYSQVVARVLYGFLGSKIEKNPNDPLKPVVHPLDELVKAQTMMYHINILALGLHLIILAFKDKGFALINSKFVAIGGQAILGNLPSNHGKYQYGEYEVPMPMPKKVAGIPVSEVLPPKKFGRLLERLLEMAYLQVASLIDTAEHGESITKINYVKSVELLSKTYGTKQDQMLTGHLAKKVGTDEELCQQLLQGVNPLMVEWVRDFKKVPLPMQNLTITENNHEVTVKALFEQKRLFIVDYSLLDDLPVKNANPGMYFYAPYLLLYREDLPNGQNRLSIVGIQLERGHSATVYQSKDTPANLWTAVKMFVTSADNNAHEFGYHLGLSHLAIEPVCVAVHNQLPKTHVLRSLLQPHLDETIGINFLARNTLVDSVLPFTNKTFVIGTQNGVAVASRCWDKFDFFASSFPGQLASRGFTRNREDGDKLTSYFYRDDGFRLWDCIGNYTTNVVQTYYKSDEDVQADKCIQKWAEEMADPARANMKGFPSTIQTKDLLAQCLQIIIWHGSASHSVINYSQWPYIGFINNRPNGLYKDIPKGKNEISDEDLEGFLAGPLPRLFQILFPWLLSAPISEDNLPALKAMSGDINNAFQSDLKDLTDHIVERNKKLEAEGKTPYVFCMPENIACSVSI
jgi:arachidonate 15-lipoxygenase